MKKKFKIVKSKLGHYYVQSPPSPKELQNYYANQYFNINPRYLKKNEKKFEETYYKNQSILRFEFIKKYIKKKRPTLLDIGAGTGRFLFYTSSYVKKSLGVDFSNKQLKYKLPKKTNFISFNPLEFVHKFSLNYDVITLNNVVEHSDKIYELFKMLKKKINNKTLILISIPNDFSDMQSYFLKKKLIKKNYWIAYPDHLNYFNNKNFINFIKKFNFKLVDAISDYPVETLLFEENFNYINANSLGKSAHHLRCKFVNFIYQNSNVHDILNYFKSCFNLGIGRNNLFIIKK